MILRLEEISLQFLYIFGLNLTPISILYSFNFLIDLGGVVFILLLCLHLEEGELLILFDFSAFILNPVISFFLRYYFAPF